MPEEFDETTIHLNNLVKENFKRLEKEQSTEEGLRARGQRRDEIHRETMFYNEKLRIEKARELAKPENMFRRYSPIGFYD